MTTVDYVYLYNILNQQNLNVKFQYIKMKSSNVHVACEERAMLVSKRTISADTSQAVVPIQHSSSIVYKYIYILLATLWLLHRLDIYHHTCNYMGALFAKCGE